jgi:hypothetical protein
MARVQCGWTSYGDEFRQVLMDLYAGRVYRRAREDEQRE